MTQQPFSRPGAVDLSGLAPAGAAAPAGAPGAPAGTAGAYAVLMDESNIQSTLEASMTAPVVLVFYSALQAPGSEVYAQDVAEVIGGFEGKYLAGLLDVDAVPQVASQLAQALQLQQVPALAILIDGRPATQAIPGVLNPEELRTIFETFGQQLTAQGISGRHKPRHTAGADGEAVADPRYAAAQDALEAGDMDRAVAEYAKLVEANPADVEAAAGLAMAKVLQRTQGVDLNTARAAAAENPEDIDAQIMVADLDMLGGHVEDAFNRLVEVVRRSVGDDKDKVRDHLIGLFAAVGNDDQRVLRGRQNLASALF